MSRVSSDEQFQFLLSCIRFSNNGKVDFAEVATECNIVSKGAAAKRYERMMKAHGINPNGGPSAPATAASPNAKGETAAKDQDDGGKTNKRKATCASTPSKKAKIKKAAIARAEKLVGLKEEGSDSETSASHGNLSHTPFLSQAAAVDSNEDKNLFDQFCNAEEDTLDA